MPPVSRISPGMCYHSEQFLYEIKLMCSHIVEIATSSNLWNHPPWQSLLIQVFLSRWAWIPYLYVLHLPDCSTVQQFLHLQEVRHVPSVVSHEARHPRFPWHSVYSRTIVITCSKRFLYINRLTCVHCHYGISRMTGRRSSDIHRIHVRVVNELWSVCIPFFYAMLLSIFFCPFLCSRHNCHNLRALHHTESRSAFLLHDLATSDKSPLYRLHKS